MQRGFARPLLVIALLLVLSLPLAVKSQFFQDLFNSKENVKGVSSTSSTKTTPGFEINVVSSGGTWEVIRYLCSTKEECLVSATSGKRVGSVGGAATAQTLKIVPEAAWSEYKFVKYFVKEGLSSSPRVFRVLAKDLSGDLTHKSFNTGDIIVAPIELITAGTQLSATFSDQ